MDKDPVPLVETPSASAAPLSVSSESSIHDEKDIDEDEIDEVVRCYVISCPCSCSCCFFLFICV